MILNVIKDLENLVQEYLVTNRDLCKMERKWGIAEAAHPGCLQSIIKKDIHVYTIVSGYLVEAMDQIIDFCEKQELIGTAGSQVQNVLNVLVSDEDTSTSWGDEIMNLYLNCPEEYRSDCDFLVHGASFAMVRFDPSDLLNKDYNVAVNLLKNVSVIRKRFIEALVMAMHENVDYIENVFILHDTDDLL